MSIEQTGLPPRRSRNKRANRPISLKKLIQSGLVLFGALFFGLIGIELYQAKVSHPTAAEDSPVVTTEEPTNVQTTPTSEQASASGQPAPPAIIEQPTQTAPSAAQVQPTPPPPGPSTAQKSGSSPSSHAGTAEVTGNTAGPAIKPATDSSKKGTPGAAVAEKPKAVKHVVKKGETLYMLSRKYYGNNSNVSRIASYNGISLEAQLTEGKVVMVPLSQ
ncbi:MAG: peptidoglycan-binding protein LysM [Brevibacillus sp.]|nr:peptidoglycan-binding protein LysM [Brevibacillus sp.]